MSSTVPDFSFIFLMGPGTKILFFFFLIENRFFSLVNIYYIFLLLLYYIILISYFSAKSILCIMYISLT